MRVKDVRLYLDEARTLGVPVEIAEAVARHWEATLNEECADSNFTSAIKPVERTDGVTVGGSEKGE
jgi:3-hydroxyisobutyrate dehydrogenase-like beta-hydroxyacid dehydrogenase